MRNHAFTTGQDSTRFLADLVDREALSRGGQDSTRFLADLVDREALSRGGQDSTRFLADLVDREALPRGGGFALFLSSVDEDLKKHAYTINYFISKIIVVPLPRIDLPKTKQD